MNVAELVIGYRNSNAHRLRPPADFGSRRRSPSPAPGTSARVWSAVIGGISLPSSSSNTGVGYRLDMDRLGLRRQGVRSARAGGRSRSRRPRQSGSQHCRRSCRVSHGLPQQLHERSVELPPSLSKHTPGCRATTCSHAADQCESLRPLGPALAWRARTRGLQA
jgi:hypothetical protein